MDSDTLVSGRLRTPEYGYTSNALGSPKPGSDHRPPTIVAPTYLQHHQSNPHFTTLNCIVSIRLTAHPELFLPVQTYPFLRPERRLTTLIPPLPFTLRRDFFSSICHSLNATIIELSCSLVSIPHVDDLGSRPPRRCTRSATSPARPVMAGNG